jgi:hypothetical protein
MILETKAEYPAMAKKLLAKLKSGELTRDDFETELAYWTLSLLHELKYNPLPTAPEDVVAYAKRKLTDREYKLTDSFWAQAHIVTWRASVSKIDSENQSNKSWLEWTKARLKTDSDREKVDAYLIHHRETTHGRDFLMQVVV